MLIMKMEEAQEIGARIVGDLERDSAPNIKDVEALLEVVRKGTNLSYFLTQLRRNAKLNKAPRVGWLKKSKQLETLLTKECQRSLKSG